MCAWRVGGRTRVCLRLPSDQRCQPVLHDILIHILRYILRIHVMYLLSRGFVDALNLSEIAGNAAARSPVEGLQQWCVQLSEKYRVIRFFFSVPGRFPNISTDPHALVRGSHLPIIRDQYELWNIYKCVNTSWFSISRPTNSAISIFSYVSY